MNVNDIMYLIGIIGLLTLAWSNISKPQEPLECPTINELILTEGLPGEEG